MSACAGCGAALQPPRGGRPRKWCSERCRKRQYDLVCVECGGRVNGTTPNAIPDRSTPVCRRCAPLFYAEWPPDAILVALQEWADRNGGIPPSVEDWRRDRALGDERVCSVSHVRWRFGTWNAAIRAAGFEPHLTGPLGGFTMLTEEQRAECASRYAAGESSVEIAADLGCAPLTVLRWARRAGVPMREPFARRRSVA